MNAPIFERPDLQGLRQLYGFGFITLLFWALWFYLWLPLVSLIAWAFGFQLFYEQMIVLGGYHSLLSLLVDYGLTILAIAALLIGWALYNLIRFRNHERRRAAAPVTKAQLAQDFNVDVNSLNNWQSARRLRVHHDPHGQIVQIDTL